MSTIALVIKEKSLSKFKLSLQQGLILLSYGFNITKEDLDYLVKANLITSATGVGSGKKYILTQEGQQVIKQIIVEGKSIEDIEVSEVELKNLYTMLSNFFPRGKKEGTNTYWRGNIANGAYKLKIFFKKYGRIPDEQIINATKAYVESFNGNYSIMRTLPYFIEKNGISDLMTFIENYSEETTNLEWTSTLK